jgi:hypothetical protein
MDLVIPELPHGSITLIWCFVRVAEAAQYLTSGRAYVQDERYFAIEHMDVRREASRGPHMCLTCPGKTIPSPQRPFPNK